MKRLPAGIISTLLSLTMTLTPCSMSALAAQENSRDFSLFFSGPGVAAFSSGDEYSEYQWALNNTGRLRRTEKSAEHQNLGPYLSPLWRKWHR